MPDDSCSRRDFLRKFAVVSTGTLVLGATTIACYGPPVAPHSSSIPMYYIDQTMAGTMVPLRGNQHVSMDAEFRIDLQDVVYFTELNGFESFRVFFTKAAGESVKVRSSWVDGLFVAVVPYERLAPATEYSLKLVSVTLIKGKGKEINFGDYAKANFRTRQV